MRVGLSEILKEFEEFGTWISEGRMSWTEGVAIVPLSAGAAITEDQTG